MKVKDLLKILRKDGWEKKDQKEAVICNWCIQLKKEKLQCRCMEVIFQKAR